MQIFIRFKTYAQQGIIEISEETVYKTKTFKKNKSVFLRIIPFV